MNIALSMTAWRRPQYFEEVLESMVNAGAASISSIIISIDGGYAEEQEAMRSIAERLLPNAKVVCQKENLGCAGNTFYALNAAFADEDVEAVIHLEDDTLLHHQFFEYMREALPRYADNPRIWSIGGYNNGSNNNAITEDWGGNNVGLHNNFTCWGWATYRRVWEEVKDDPPKGRATLSEFPSPEMALLRGIIHHGTWDFARKWFDTQFWRDER